MTTANPYGAAQAVANSVGTDTSLVLTGDSEHSAYTVPLHIRNVIVNSSVNFALTLPDNAVMFQPLEIKWNIPGEFSLAVLSASGEAVYASYVDTGVVTLLWAGTYWAVLASGVDAGTVSPNTSRTLKLFDVPNEALLSTTLTIDTTVHTFVASNPGTNEIVVGATAAESMYNIAAALDNTKVACARIYLAGRYSLIILALPGITVASSYAGGVVDLTAADAALTLYSMLCAPVALDDPYVGALARIDALETALAARLAAASDTAEIEISGIVATDTFTFDATEYTFVSALTTGNQILVGEDDAETLENIAEVLEDLGCVASISEGTLSVSRLDKALTLEFSAHGTVTYTAPAVTVWHLLHAAM